MLQRLRRKFIAINMLMVSVVVIAVLIAIGAFAWQQSESLVYSALDRSLESATSTRTFNHFGLNLANPLFNGTTDDFDSAFFQNDESTTDDGTSSTEDSDGADGQGANSANSWSGPSLGKNEESTVPVAVYQMAGNDTAMLVSRVTTASLDDDVLQSALADLTSLSDDHGVLQSERLFYKRLSSNGFTYVAFADTSSATSWQSLVFPLVGVGLLTLLVFFVLSLFFSRWALRPVEETWEQQKQFVADASHELKTPITVILANTSIMLKHSENSVGSQSQWLESTQHEAEGMQELVNDMLTLARAESDDAAALFEPVSFSDLAEGSLLQFESVAFERQVLIDDEVAPNLTVKGNRSQLERLTVILLDNACKYATPGSTIEVSLRSATADALHGLPHSASRGTAPHGTCVILTVTNSGNPIDPEDLPHLFDRFYRSDKARTRTEGSYGLGLAIAAKTAESHGGEILVQSTPEGKTSFMVALPLS